MVLARWQAHALDDEGNVLAGAQVTVRQERPGAPLASLFSDRDGLVAIGNPVTADTDGYFGFHVTGGAYRIDAVLGGNTRTWRYVGIGLGAETDGRSPGVEMFFDTGTSDADPGAGQIRFNNASLASATKLFISETSGVGMDIASWIGSWDDSGASGNRGTLLVQNADGSATVLATVTGTIADDGAYRDVSLTVVSSTGAFLDEESVFVAFSINGANGLGDVTGPAGGVVDNEIPLYNSTTGKLIKGSGGALLTTVGAGRQTQWIPAGAMRPRATNGAAIGTFGVGMPTLDFDQTAAEFAIFSWPIPKQWNRGTVTFKPYWTAGAGTAAQTCIFSLAGAAISNDDAMAAPSFGTLQTSSDALIATSDLHIGPESAAITISGTPADEDLIMFQLARDISDTLAADARLLGIRLFYTTAANTDA